MNQKKIEEAVNQLGRQFQDLNWNFEEDDVSKAVLSHWLGEPKEDIMMCVFKGKHIHEQFHRQDFFFLNYAYENDYTAVSAAYSHQEHIAENDCYIAQPDSGYAIRAHGEKTSTILGILVKRGVFYRDFLPTLSGDPAVFQFFMKPEITSYSDEYLHFNCGKDDRLRSLLEIMCIEYADKTEETDNILKPLAISAFLMAARMYNKNIKPVDLDISEQMITYIHTHPADASLASLSRHFSYHPNYISSLLHAQTGKTFSQLLLTSRMEMAASLLKTNALKTEEIAMLCGYSTVPAFYKAFQSYYGSTPKKYQIIFSRVKSI